MDSDRLIQLETMEIDILRKMRRHRLDNPIVYFELPNPKQQLLLEAWEDRSKKVFIFAGGNRSGKTTIGVIIALSTLFGVYPWNQKPVPIDHAFPRKIRYIGQDWEKHIGRVCIPALRKWWPKSRPLETKKNHLGYETLWKDTLSGSTLELMSNNQESELHEGWEGDLIVYDEPPKRDIRIANARGLVDRNGRELICATLLKEPWIDREIVKAKLPDGSVDQSIFVVHATTFDNVGYGITKEGIDEFQKKLTADEIQARIYGIPSYMSGLVFPQFNTTKHVKLRFDIPTDWPVDIAIDIHPREKQAVLFIAISPHGYKYICDEIWDNYNAEELADQILKKIKSGMYRVNRMIIDPLSKGDRNNEHTVFDRIDCRLAAYGYGLETASKDKSQGIGLITSHLISENKEPTLFFFHDLRRTVYEMEGWMWDEDTQKPQDKDDHMMENLYRLLLLNTIYTEPQRREDNEFRNHNRNKFTGY